MVINDDLPDKEKLHKALRVSIFNMFHRNRKTGITSSVYSERIQVGSVGGKVPQYWIIKMSARMHYP